MVFEHPVATGCPIFLGRSGLIAFTADRTRGNGILLYLNKYSTLLVFLYAFLEVFSKAKTVFLFARIELFTKSYLSVSPLLCPSIRQKGLG